MITRSARYLLAKLLFMAMGLRVSRYRREVENLWSLSEEARLQALEKLLVKNRPINSEGVEVTGLEALRSSPPLSKKQLRSKTAKEEGNNDLLRFGRHTAGTTGEPTHVALNREELARMLGVRDYCFRHYGVKLGQREARLWGRSESSIKSRLKSFVMNRRVFHPVGSEAMHEVADLLDWKPDYLYGYASLLLEAAKVLESMDLEFEPPKLVVCTAESILPAQKAYISQAFRAPVAEEYGSTEFDVIAFECTEGHRHLVNPWLIVEEGQENGLISDVSRSTQNLVRYQLGDSFTIKSVECKNLEGSKYIESLQGRTIDLFFFFNENDKVHIITISRILDNYFSENGDIFSFLMEQNFYSEINLIVDSTPVIGSRNLEILMKNEIKKITGFDVSVNVLVEIKRKENGKRNYFLQNMTV